VIIQLYRDRVHIDFQYRGVAMLLSLLTSGVSCMKSLPTLGGHILSPLAIAITVALGLQPTTALSEDEAPGVAPRKDKMTELLDKLRSKGVIDEDEYQELAGETPEARAEARAERRRMALKKAQEEEAANARKTFYNLRWNNGLVFETPDRANSVNISGRIHADYRSFREDSTASGFDVRRAYLTIAGKYNEWLTWDVTGDFAQQTTSVANAQSNGGSMLDVAWFNMAFSDRAQLRVGQFKMPMTLEELTSSRFIDFQERSFVDKMAPAKERGAMLHGVPRVGMTYALALSNGAGKNGNEVTPQFDRPEVIGRITANFAEFIGAQARSVYHVGGSFSQGTLAGGTLSMTTEPRSGSAFGGGNFFSTATFSGTGVDRTRLGLEAVVALGPVKFQGEWLNTNYTGRSAAGTAYDKDIEAHYVSVLWMITGERYAETYRNGVFGRMVPYSNYSPGGTGTGAWELGLRWSSFNASDFTGNSANGTGVLATLNSNKADALTGQIKWIATPNLRFYLDYVDTKFGSPVRFATGNTTISHERAITMRAAFDF
jgi:phosphate-selective porin OprO/OprP